MTDDLPVLEFFIRMATTAFVVIFLAKAMTWVGPKLAGTVAGLPIVVGPGFYFMIEQGSNAFLADAAAYALYALCAAQIFLLAYICSAGSASPTASLAAAVLAWLSVVLLVRHIPPNSLLGLVLYITTTVVVRRLSRSRILADEAIRGLDNHWVILLRGGLAGIMVGCVTLAASAIGPDWSGLLISFPIAFTVLSVTVHEMLGRAAVISMLHAAMLGTASLAAFCAGLTFLAPRLDSHLALGAALLLSLAVTSFLTIWVGFGSSRCASSG